MNESEFQSLLGVVVAKSAAGAVGERRIKEAIDDFYEGWREMKEGFADLNIPSTRLTQKFHREGWQLGYLDEQLEMISESLQQQQQPEDGTGERDDAEEEEEEEEEEGFGIEEFIGSVGGRRGLGAVVDSTTKTANRNPSPPPRRRQ